MTPMSDAADTLQRSYQTHEPAAGTPEPRWPAFVVFATILAFGTVVGLSRNAAVGVGLVGVAWFVFAVLLIAVCLASSTGNRP